MRVLAKSWDHRDDFQFVLEVDAVELASIGLNPEGTLHYFRDEFKASDWLLGLASIVRAIERHQAAEAGA